jgi:hypothetical protein
VEDHPGFVFCRPTAAQATIAFGRLERRRDPLLGRTWWLYVVVCMQQHGRCSRRALHLAVYRRVCPLDLEETNPRHSRVVQEIGDGVGRPPHLCGVEIRSRNGGNPNQLLEFFARSGEARVDGGSEIIMHGLGRLAPRGLMLEWGSL